MTAKEALEMGRLFRQQREKLVSGLVPRAYSSIPG